MNYIALFQSLFLPPMTEFGGDYTFKAKRLRCVESMFQESVNTAGPEKYIDKPLKNITQLITT